MEYTQKQLAKIQSNIWKYGFLLICNKRLYVAILTIYYLSIDNIQEKQIGIILAVSSLVALIIEMPTGYISDKLGHKTAIIISKILMCLSSYMYIISDSMVDLIAGSVLLSASFAFNSGSAQAFMHDTLIALKKDDQYSKIVGKLSSLGYFIPLLIVTMIPFLYNYDIKAPFVLSLIIDVIALAVACSLVRIKRTEKEKKHIKETKLGSVFKEGISSKFISYSIFNSFIMSIIYVIGIFRAVHMEQVGVLIIYLGIIHSIGRLLASALLIYNDKLKNMFSFNSFIITKTIIYGFLILLLATFNNWQVVIFAYIVMNGLQWGLTVVTNNFQLNLVKDSKFKATLLSIKSLVRSGLVLIFSLIMGAMYTQYGYQDSYKMILGFYIIVSLVIYITLIKDKPLKPKPIKS